MRLLAAFCSSLFACAGAAHALDFKTERTAFFTIDVPAAFTSKLKVERPRLGTGTYRWESPNRSVRLLVELQRTPRGDAVAHVHQRLGRELLPRVAGWKELSREVLDVEGRRVVLLFGQGFLRRNQRVHAHGVAHAAYVARRGVLCTLTLLVSHHRIDDWTALIEHVMESMKWLEGPPPRERPSRRGKHRRGGR